MYIYVYIYISMYIYKCIYIDINLNLNIYLIAISDPWRTEFAKPAEDILSHHGEDRERAYYFYDYIYIVFILLLEGLCTSCEVNYLWPLVIRYLLCLLIFPGSFVPAMCNRHHVPKCTSCETIFVMPGRKHCLKERSRKNCLSVA